MTQETKTPPSASRRQFMAAAGAVAAGVTIVPRHVLAASGQLAPSDRLNIAICGAGGRGANMATELLQGGHNLAHICDVDLRGMDARIERGTRNNQGQPVPARIQLLEAYRKAPQTTDYRRMLEQRDLDGIVIATPDHTHAVIAKAAMEMGKHVFVEKPLTWSVHEARVLRDVARRTGVVTQMGNQGQSTDGARLINEWIQAGLIGPVREVHISTNRPVWPQGVPRPPRNPAAVPPTAYTSKAPLPPGTPGGDWDHQSLQRLQAMAMGSHAMPQGLNWDMFLGPAPEVPYHPVYHPFNWRGWLDWGVGAVGDIAAHTLNHPYWALGLTYPETVEATSSPFGLDEDGNPASYPMATEIVFRYPAAGARPAVTMYWRDGGLWSPRPPQLPDSVRTVPAVVIVGDKGILTHETYGNDPKLYPETLMEQAARVPRTLARVPGQLHAMNWANAIRTGAKATSDFDYASRVTENMLLGIVALRTGQGVQIRYDGATGTVPGNATANALLHREYRRGWTL